MKLSLLNLPSTFLMWLLLSESVIMFLLLGYCWVWAIQRKTHSIWHILPVAVFTYHWSHTIPLLCVCVCTGQTGALGPFVRAVRLQILNHKSLTATYFCSKQQAAIGIHILQCVLNDNRSWITDSFGWNVQSSSSLLTDLLFGLALFGNNVVTRSQGQPDFHTSALDHKRLPAEARFPNKRSDWVWIDLPHSCLKTVKQKIASTRFSRTRKQGSCNCMLLCFFTCFLTRCRKTK